MQLELSHDDEAGFGRVREQVLDGLEGWLKTQPAFDEAAARDAVFDVGIALDWKFGYGDGHLGRWTADDVTDFLLRWCPRKLSVSQADGVSLPRGLAALTDYLAADGLLAPGSASAAQLRDAASAAAREFVTAMADPANFGMAKSIFMGAVADGVDPGDPAQFEAWMSEFNSLSDEARRALVPDSAFDIGGGGGAVGGGAVGSRAADTGAPSLTALPPVPARLPEAVLDSEASAPVLRMFAELARFVGTGRPLTQRGNLTLADARALVPLLRTGDSMDEQTGDRTFRMRSSADLPVLHLVFSWAKKAGMLRVQHGKVLATKRGLALAGSPAAEFDRALDALLALGPASAQRVRGAWLDWPEVDELLDVIVLHLLVPPYVARRPVPIAKLGEIATDMVLRAFAFPQPTDRLVAMRLGFDVARIARALELAGVLRCTSLVEGGTEHDQVLPFGDDAELTPAGVAALQKRLPGLGYDVPVTGLLAASSAADLVVATAAELAAAAEANADASRVAGLDAADRARLTAEVESWLERRTGEQAAAELAGAVAELTQPSLQYLALAMLSELGLELAEPRVRHLAESPASRGFALSWLADHGMIDVRDLYDPADLDSFAQVLFLRLIVAEPEGMLETLALAGDAGQQARVATDLGRSSAPSAETVLEAIGTHHAVRTVAKSARKALFLRRSQSAARR